MAGVIALAIATAVGPPTPASATPPSAAYTVTVGAAGDFPYQTDSPASPYIDKDGTFYFQQSYNQYNDATTPDHYFQFFSGTTMDTATLNTGISNATDPDNPQDSNANTVWRCQHSPTGLTATPSSGYPLGNYCDLIGTWVDPDTGDWYGLVHNEFTGQPFGDGLHFDSIDWAVSHNQGHTWAITGHAITSPYSTTRGDTGAFPQQSYYYGDGDQRLFADVASGYFYLYYTSRVVPKGGVSGATVSQAHVARCPMSAKMTTGCWHKWYDGTWSQPGVGGSESNMVPVSASNSTGYTPVAGEYSPSTPGSPEDQVAAGKLPPKADLLTMNIAYDAYLGLYIGEPEVIDQDAGATQRFYVTDDLSTQKWHLIGDTGSRTTGSWYRWFLDSVNKTSSTIIGKTFRSYCSVNCMDLGSKTDITISSTAPAVPPVDTSKTYLIGSASGRVLAQTAGGSATTSVPAATGSALESWKFSPRGDGSFTIANASTGRLLGVDSSTTATRAWATKPTATAPGSGGATVGQQWWIIKNTTGTFRLVNRYSGLALAMSSNAARPAETTPSRSWTNSTGNAVGGTRTADEQTLTFAPTGSPATDLAQGKPTTASSVESPSYPAAYATDGSPGTRWSSGSSDPQWLRVDLGSTHTIREVKLNWEAAYGRAFTVQTSPDSRTWTTIYSTTKGTGGVQDLTGLAGSGRYVRIYGTARGTGYGYSLWSFEVHGT
ncbi:Ricin-type beta-trefoil lectin domain-like [Actinacidiphila alni]|uniref:Ricin-type beta-trefoil lectin domain-like n=1 Tax=Actinacidiphila alni TaxID=380248 RepID=A0A1I2LFE5_9ACTN|nr:discoidin domain-containing protein [Actinacidiphila alni]SFF77169.1 Ricin-type beta-trefoil lectin domain-like [Actinacidiphila alni]